MLDIKINSYEVLVNGELFAFTFKENAAKRIAEHCGNNLAGLIELKNEKGEVIWSKFNKSLYEVLSEE